MADKKKENIGYRRVANVFSVVMVLFLGTSFIVETMISSSVSDYSFTAVIIISALAIVFAMIKTTIHHYKLAFNIPITVFLFYTFVMVINNWVISHYFLVCFTLCVISCIYSSFTRSVVFVIVQNIIIGFLILRGNPVSGAGVSVLVTLVNWAICLLGQIALLLITRSATVVLNKAIEQQHSFNDLLATTENYVAMIDERNKVVYASRTLSQIGSVEDPALVQGWPLIDLFPGKTLKLYAGKMLKDKENYAEDWEFSLHGQKRYFKAASHGLRGSSGTLINLYDMTHLAERDEIAAMKDSMKIGLFFMDQNYVIQDHYSRYLEEMLSEKDLFGKLFTDVIADSVTSSELESIKDYFGMVTERSYDQEMLDDINPLNELYYVNARTGDRKVFQFSFATVERTQGEIFLLVTVYDITTKVELQQRLAEEEAKRQEEMQSFFELVQVQPDVFSDFMEDMEYEFDNIDKILKNTTFSAHDVLVKVYQSIHAIKSNAVILGLNVFGRKVHNLESKVKKLREITDDVPFAEMLNLTMEIEKISQEKEGFRDIIDKLQSYSGGVAGGKRQNVKVLLESLAKAASRAAEDLEKQVQFVSDDVDPEAIDKGPRRVMKEILTQIVRNSVVHGVEKADIRKAKGKNETGVIKLSIKMTDNHEHIHIKISDDGRGLDYKKISERAIDHKVIKKEDADNKDVLLKAIFAPGFSTADDSEGIHGGRGIGLNLVRDRVKEVNGSIRLRSDTDKGVMFFISIPVK